MSLSKSDWIGIGVTVLVAGLTAWLSPKAGLIMAAIGIAIILRAHFIRERKNASPSATKSDWLNLASRFREFIPHARAEWYAEDFAFDGELMGEQWLFRDNLDGRFAENCESLSRLAGAMLLKSPNIAVSISEKVRSRSDDARRWLYFLQENHGALKMERKGATMGARLLEVPKFGTIENVADVSARVCVECAAKEI